MLAVLQRSILELTIAIPTHIYVRQRNDCCAPYNTLIGILVGLSVAFLTFGPGLFFLFAERVRRKRGPGKG